MEVSGDSKVALIKAIMRASQKWDDLARDGAVESIRNPDDEEQKDYAKRMIIKSDALRDFATDVVGLIHEFIHE